MNLLFISREYHPNHHPIVKSLQDDGHNIKFITLAIREGYNHDALSPTIVGYSKLKEWIECIKNYFGYNTESHPPNIIKLYSEIVKFNPDVVIIRNYEIYSILSFLISKCKGYNTVFHEQMAMCRSSVSWKKTLVNKTHHFIFDTGLTRITPISGDCNKFEPVPNVYYLPFVVDPEFKKDFDKKSFFRNDKINIIMVGKLWQERKNHLHLLEAVDSLRKKYDIHLTLVGTLPKSKSDKKILDFIKNNNLNSVVEIKRNLPFEELQELYFKHDLYILPSCNEPAAVSLLEAMAQGLAVISSDDNGTQWYIEPEKNGLVFEAGNVSDLEEKIELVIEDRTDLVKMGSESYRIAHQNHHPDVYKEDFINVVHSVFYDGKTRTDRCCND